MCHLSKSAGYTYRFFLSDLDTILAAIFHFPLEIFFTLSYFSWYKLLLSSLIMMMMQYRDCRLSDVNKWRKIDSIYMKSHTTHCIEPLLLKWIELNFLNFRLIFQESLYLFFLSSVYNAKEMLFDCASKYNKVHATHSNYPTQSKKKR